MQLHGIDAGMESLAGFCPAASSRRTFVCDLSSTEGSGSKGMKGRVMSRMVLSLLVGLAGVGSAWSQDPVVWVASPWQHVLRSTEPGGAKSAEIVAARNEYEPLRVIIHAGAQALANVQRGSQRSERACRADRGRKHRPVSRTLHQCLQAEPSLPRRRPAGIPDALIPIAGGDPGPSIRSMPMSVEPGTNQGVWVDVYVPRDTAPGEYSGTITVTADGKRLSSVP